MRTLSFILMTASVVSAQPEEPSSSADVEARAVFLLGQSAFSDGRYDEALEHFEQAYELSPRPEMLYNIGASADRLRENGKALRFFVEYLEALPNAANRRAVEARIRVIRFEIQRERELEENLARAEAEAGEPRRRGWTGGVVGAIVAVGVAALAVGLVVSRDDGPPLVRGTEPVVRTLWRAP